MSNSRNTDIFELAPVAMWIEDFSEVRAQFDLWRAAGVEDLRTFLREDLSRVSACSSRIKILQVNAKTLDLFEARDFDDLKANLDKVFWGDMLESHINELVELWDGKTAFAGSTVNYTLSGRRLDIQLRGAVLPGHEEKLDRLLITTEDVTTREEARRAEERNRLHAEGIFEYSPVSLWMEDFSAIYRLMARVRESGIVDFRVFLDVHPEFIQQCMSEIRVLNVNKATLNLFGAASRENLFKRLPHVFRDAMEKPFKEQLIDLWEGRLHQHREVVNYALDGNERHLLMNFSVLPGHEEDWSLVQVALTDITARKKAESYLEYLGKHDVLTRLHNRAFYTDELNRLERKSLRPVSAVIIDLNGLKEANDQLGHEAGDALLRRFGEVLNGVASAPVTASRIGGDEFALLMPGADFRAASSMADTIRELLKINNQFYSDAPISMSLGFATSEPGESIESVVRRADALMFEEKRAYYADNARVGRSSVARQAAR